MNVINLLLLLLPSYAAVAEKSERDVVSEILNNITLSFTRKETVPSFPWSKPPEIVTYAPMRTTPPTKAAIYAPCEDNGVCVTALQCNNKRGEKILTNKSYESCADASLICCKSPPSVSGVGQVPSTVPSTVSSTVPEPVTRAGPRKVGCGWRNEDDTVRSLGGEETAFGEFPWTVAIFKVDAEYGEEYFCTGSLIHYRVVLSTGIRFKRKKQWIVRAGEYQLFTQDIEEFQASEVENAIVHPSFNYGTKSHNIALLFLAKEIILESKPHIGFACLPAHTQVLPPDTMCIASGWWSDDQDDYQPSNVMKMVELPIVQRGACQQALRTVANPRLTLDTSAICAGGKRGQDTCRGAGGGPLVCLEPGTRGRYYQAGIVSWGKDCGTEGIPGVYTNVAELRPWIDEQMSSKNYSTQTYTPTHL